MIRYTEDRPRKRQFISRTAPAPHKPAAAAVAPVMGKGRRAADDLRVKRKRTRRRSVLLPLPEKA